MDESGKRPLAAVPVTAVNHFGLHVQAAVYYLAHFLRRLAGADGAGLEQLLAAYPFFAAYFGQAVAAMPDDLSWEAGLDWWAAALATWEQEEGERLPLLALDAQGTTDVYGRVALALVGLVEEDSRFGTLLAEVQRPLPTRRPTLELITQTLAANPTLGAAGAAERLTRLRLAGLVAVTDDALPRAEWPLRVPPLLWPTIRGEGALAQVAGGRLERWESLPELADLVAPADFVARARQAAALLAEGQARTVVVRGSPGSDRQQVLGAIARRLGRHLLLLDEVDTQAGLGPLCALTGALPALVYDLPPGETAVVPALPGYEGPVGVLLGLAGGARGTLLEGAITLLPPPLDADQRARQWRAALGDFPARELAAISERMRLPAGYIRQAAPLAVAEARLAGRTAVTLADARAAACTLNHQLLDTLAAPVTAVGDWSRLVVGEGTAARLQELVYRCRHRERLGGHLGVAFAGEESGGVRALFTGGSGTGKTLAARILAAELGMALYRVDLAAVVNKYIGETEKNLHQILTRAEELDVILLLDEGDALLGRRTEVRSANDRYANLETNYLLQRLEQYRGIVLVTTNAGENIDAAFQRRMDVVAHFVAPQAEARRRIWELHLPPEHEVAAGWLAEVATRCALTGGQIRNAALHATLLALDGETAVAAPHLLQAIQSEYRKAGATSPLNGNGHNGQSGDGVAAFLQTLA